MKAIKGISLIVSQSHFALVDWADFHRRARLDAIHAVSSVAIKPPFPSDGKAFLRKLLIFHLINHETVKEGLALFLFGQ